MVTWKRTLVFSTVGGLSVPLMYLMFARRIELEQLLNSTVFSLSYSTCIGILIHFSLMWLGPRLQSQRPWSAWALLLAILVCCASVGCIAGTALAMTLLGVPWSQLLPIAKSSLRVCIPVSLAVGIVSGLVENARSQLRATELELRTGELRRERAEKLAAEARLSSLESRIHPHFLFNALNSVSCLIREDPERAERLIERLSSLLRFSLDSNQLGLVPLSKELKVVADYLEIEKTRFGDRLRYSIDAAAELGETEVPPLSIQTLVENSIKYAVSPRMQGGAIWVTVREGSVEVRDDGPGFSLNDVPQGHGLDLLQSRLEAIFGASARLEVEHNMVRFRLYARVPAG
ncbi:MAG: histidine kinase [Bryobacteraceae bacterium]|nr:histidine kinase [Bryobacteraceae bacterium]